MRESTEEDLLDSGRGVSQASRLQVCTSHPKVEKFPVSSRLDKVSNGAGQGRGCQV